MLMQNHGFLASINGIVSCAQLYRIPLLMLISYRGEFGERDPWQTEGGGVTEDLLRALRIPFVVSRRARITWRSASRKAQTLALVGEQAGGAAAVPRSDVGGAAMMRARRAAARSTRGSSDAIVVTIMGAVAAELQSLGHRPNFFYLQHAMGLASSMGLGIALAQPESPGRRVRRRRLDPDEPRRPDDAGALPAAQPGARRLRQREPAVGRRLPDRDRRPAATSPASPRPPACRAPRTVRDARRVHAARSTRRSRAGELTTLVAKVEAVGPSGYVTDLSLLENRFQFQTVSAIVTISILDRSSSTSSTPAR